ncbi:hypothetical protein [Rhizobium leguminosarum]|uniref:hypothetical protein n=1 Tax=Rhizobium leguminosarum TaxID=384 RepID=UPI003F9C70C6
MSEMRVSDALLRSLPGLIARARSGNAMGATRPATQPHLNQAAHRAVNRVVSSSARNLPTCEERAKEIGRRRKWAGGGNMPPEMRAGYSESERAALAVIGHECRRRGLCGLCIDEIARLAGVGRTTVQNAIRKARSKERAHISVRERPQEGGKNLTNIIKIICGSWLGWIARAIGFKRLNTSETTVKNSLSEGVGPTKLALERESASSLFEQLDRRSGGSEEVRFRVGTRTAESAEISAGGAGVAFPRMAAAVIGSSRCAAPPPSWVLPRPSTPSGPGRPRNLASEAAVKLD